MNYLSNTPEERKKMLATIGVESVEELFSVIPERVALQRPLAIPGNLSELELLRGIKQLSEKNVTMADKASFLGAGAYDHYIPSIIDHLISRQEFYTAYTPYQAELSQGTLEAIYEFQSMICELTGMDIANASMLDGGSATAEALLMASRVTRKKKIVYSRGINPAYIEVARTYGKPRGLEFVEVSLNGTKTDVSEITNKIDQDTAALVIQYPNFYGSIEEVQKIKEIMENQKALLVVIANPIALGLLKPPAEYGADIVVGEGQSLGNGINYGGPYLGFMAIKDDRKLMRQLPGRLVGATTDVDGKTGYVLTLQTREQHIRREKATSNICSNESLNALVATIYMATMGKQGIKEVAEQSLKKAHYLADKIDQLQGFEVVNKDNFFHEFLLKSPLPVVKIKEKLLTEGIIAGLDLSRFGEEGLLVCVTEKRTRKEMDRYVQTLEVIAND